MKISVSYLKSAYEKKETLQKISQTSCDFLHVDLMDGIFAGEKNFTLETVKEDLKEYAKPLDIHLMIQNPQEEIASLSKLHPKYMTIPVEILEVEECIDLITNNHISVGLAVSPDTDVKKLLPYLDRISLILIMSVYPGKGGQEFLSQTIEKLKEVRKLLALTSNNILLSVDGGINNETISLVSPYVDMVVSGSYICLNENFEKQITSLRQ